MSVSCSYLTEVPIQNVNFGLKNKPNHLITREDSRRIFVDRVLMAAVKKDVLYELHTAW